MIYFTSIVQQSNGSWQFTWTPTAAPYYRVILYGKQISGQLTSPTYNFNLPHYEKFPPSLEIAEGSTLALSELYPPYLTMQWYDVVGCFMYEVDERKSGNWVKITSIVETGTLPVYTYITPLLADETSYRFQVMALSKAMEPSTPMEFDEFVVTPPLLKAGDVAVTYNPTTHMVTVSAA